MAAPFHPPAIAPTPAPTAAPPPAPMAVRLPGVAQATARGARKQKVRYFRMTTPCFAALERLARCVSNRSNGRPNSSVPGHSPHTYICSGCEKRCAFGGRDLIRRGRLPRGTRARHRDRLVLPHMFTALARHLRFLRHRQPVDLSEMLIRDLAGNLLSGRVAPDELGVGERLRLPVVQVGFETVQLAEDPRGALHRFRL